MSIGDVHHMRWEQEERRLRRDEVDAQVSAAKAQRRASKYQLWAVAAALLSALLSTLVAGWAAYMASQAAKSTENNNTQQADQNQLSTAIAAIGSTQPAERIAGLILLRRNAAARVSYPLPVPGGKREAYNTYATALNVLGGYIHANSDPTLSSLTNNTIQSTFGFGYGIPPHREIPLDVLYAGDELARLLNMRGLINSLGTGRSPAIDLANDQLYGQHWPYIKFNWLSAAYMPYIDLRGADLEHSSWGKVTYLRHAYLQCADLKDANMRGTNLIGADLRGAYVDGANFMGAKLNRAKLGGIVGNAKGLRPGLPTNSWHPAACEANQKYWDNLPRAGTP